jgi:predicted nucleic acid-binding protein
MPLFLDTGVLGLVTHPRAKDEAAACIQWLHDCIAAGATICVPEVADYELRRELVLNNSQRALRNLNELVTDVAEYIPLNTTVMRTAADLWAELRRRGQPTADARELDGDVILAAQAREFATNKARIVVTNNVGHLSRMIQAERWQDLPAADY